MPKAFLLRFEEYCVDMAGTEYNDSTKTKTKVLGEKPEDDLSGANFDILRRRISAGTSTVTEVRRESNDVDAREGMLNVIPREAGIEAVKTLTYVDGEAPRDDNDRGSVFAIPQSQFDMTMATKTATAISAETPDDDVRRGRGGSVFPKCS